MRREYKEKEPKQLRAWFSNKKSSKPDSIGFESSDDFIDGYSSIEKKCYYCGISEQESREIVLKGLLTSKRFPFNGDNIQPGRNRGIWLEIDRKNPNGLYSKENCVLSCYFCNNDKSDVFDSEQYRAFNDIDRSNNPRCAFLRKLLQDIADNQD